ncbi:MAG: hypothetical protein C3F02_02735 [Parcubacteria group bacterium]|nr:MAG: hypothetical protein C3F02_02735 [Parcubacteria group bacterium]
MGTKNQPCTDTGARLPPRKRGPSLNNGTTIFLEIMLLSLILFNPTIINLFIQKILNKLAIFLADSLLWLKNKLGSGLRGFGRLLAGAGKVTILPIILFLYKNILLTKIRLKNFDWLKLRYLTFFKKYLPGLIIIMIITIATSHNILAKNYTAEEYVNRTLLPAMIQSSDEERSTIVEEKAPVTATTGIINYLDEQGSLQEIVISTPFQSDAGSGYGDVTADASSLVLNTPENSAETSGEDFGDSAPVRSENISYTVQAGDVLGSIAEKFDISVNTILWANGLNWSSTIRPGQKLVILPGSGINYEVKKGDVLSSVAKKYQADVEKIIPANNLANASNINAGDLIFIPDGVKPTAVVSSYKPAKTETIPSVVSKPMDLGTKFLWPAVSTRITQYFSWRHTGVDIGDKTGNPIYAAEDGKVTRAGWSRGYGNNVIINHGNGVETLYGHASKLLVEEGETVSRGQLIALIGSTGWSTGPHLHFEVRVNGVRQNGLNYIK